MMYDMQCIAPLFVVKYLPSVVSVGKEMLLYSGENVTLCVHVRQLSFALKNVII